MARLFSETVINDVLERSNIVEVISSYIPLKRTGRNYKTICPFHPEKTPSFIISSDKQIFHCFGCGVGGNALTFIMQYEKINFKEALQTLAQRAGIPLPEPEYSDFQKTSEDLRSSLYSIYEKACEFYHANLMSSPDAKQARAYLQKRGISKEAAQRFRLGFALPGWESLITHLRSRGAKLALIEKSGLVISKETGGYYDRFRNRILFPIINLKDKVIGFGARVLDDSLPKYVNSCETAIYSKGKNLFGFNLSKDFIRTADSVIVVEGYLDMIIPFEAGIKNIVASLGTALTIEQIKLIKRYTTNVIMLYDPDLAGELATLRALELFIKEDMNVKIARLPKGQDPDSFVRKDGQQAFLKVASDSQPIFDYKLQCLISKHNPETISGKDKIIREILPTIKKFTSASIRRDNIRTTAQILNINEETLYEDLKKTKIDDYDKTDDEFASIEHCKMSEIPVTEKMLIKLMLDEIHHIERIRTLVDPSDFREEKLRKIVKFIFDFFMQGRDCKPNILINYLGDDEAINIISELATLEIHETSNKEKLISDCVKRLKRDNNIQRCRQLHREIEAAQAQGNHEIIKKLISEYNALIKKRSQLHGEVPH